MPVTVVCADASCRAAKQVQPTEIYNAKCDCGNMMLPEHDFLTSHRLPASASATTKVHVATTMSMRPASASPSIGSIELSPPSGPTLASGEPPRSVDLETPFLGSYGEDDQCITCSNKDTHLLPLGVSWITQSTCARIAELCMQGKVLKTGKGGSRGFMLGVLEVDNQLLVTTSGDIPSGFEAVVRGKSVNAGLHSGSSSSSSVPSNSASSSDSSPVIAPAVPVRMVKGAALRITAGGAKIDGVRLREVVDRTPAKLFECAAPKLVSYALHNVLDTQAQKRSGKFNRYVSWSMTEMWVGPTDGYHRHGVTYASCANCAQILPMMLCSRAPTSLTGDDGFTMAVGKGGKRAAARGDYPFVK
ncbi:hypothetical protein [Dyella choica]|uniref:Uncharacterized protein n=1 Tax=Dyella choica TaxID=1927959 RepID=A0A3S0RYF5_9GAMM|nr:hypothetical protein [Dyella choica]RUL72503.1 hypothetical protein EKH80_17650 [Dyella choica]